MRIVIAASGLIAAVVCATAALAAAPPEGAPGGTTGICKDGTFSSSTEKKGACRGHQGVKEWYSQGAAAATGEPSRAGAPAATPTAQTQTPRAMPTTPAAAAVGSAAAGQVWANDGTKTYHCSGDRWYGKTRHGEYMTEGDAKAKGFHAAHGKACG